MKLVRTYEFDDKTITIAVDVDIDGIMRDVAFRALYNRAKLVRLLKGRITSTTMAKGTKK